MMQKQWKLWMPLAIFAFVAGIALYGLMQPNDMQQPSALVGRALPQFALPAATADGSGLSDKDFMGGKPRMLNVFASWCIPCKAEAPQLEALKKAGVQIHGLAVADKPEDVAAFFGAFGNPYAKVGADKDYLVQLSLGSKGVPETFIVNAKGVITHHHIGDIRAEHVASLLKKMKEAE